MNWIFELRGRQVGLTLLEGAAAVLPEEDLRVRASRSELAERFGTPALDDAGGGRFGIDLPAGDRSVFERAGWLFVEPRAEVARAAIETRSTVPSAEGVLPAFIDHSGNLLLGTDLVTVQVNVELPEQEAISMLSADGLTLVRRLRFSPNTFEVRLPAGRSLPEVVSELQARRDLYQFAEPTFLQVLTGRFVPTDPRYGEQWQHSNDGSNGGLAGADIHSEAAWDLTRGRGPNRPVRIAVIDNGMQVNHPDLSAGITGGGFFQNNGQGSAAFVRYAPGIAVFPDTNHGTFCMGMAGARVQNDRGGCGSAPEADLLAIACLPDQVGTQTTLARAVAYAADPTREDNQADAADGADVISCSLGPNGADWDLTTVLDLAIQFAASRGRNGLGTPIFWAASNGFVAIDRDEVCSHPDVIAVGRSNRNDLQDGSAFGPKLEFLAPGVEVFSSRSGSGYGLGTGTSYAAPLAAGVGALVLARNPNRTRQEVLNRLRATCDKVGGIVYDPNGHHNQYGFGRINAERAVQ